MNDKIKVHVVDYGADRNLVMRYLDPLTGKHVTKSAKTRIRKDAERTAAKWEAELHEGRYAKPSRMTWDAFREYYRTNKLPSLAKRTRDAYESSLNVFESMCRPQKLAEVTTAKVTSFVTSLRETGSEEATIASHLRHLKAAVRYAAHEGLLSVTPKFTMPKHAKGAKIMRGRPITLEEFERMIGVVAIVVDNVAAASWKFYLRALWWSGLRLSESLTLSWDDSPDVIVLDFSEKRPMFRIPSEAEKGKKDRLLPMAPEFATLLGEVPVDDRQGLVFKLLDADGSLMSLNRSDVGKIISAIGKKAGVKVDERKKAGKTKFKFASAHDLRRSFGQRWARHLMPDDLMALLRHETIDTTMKYYVGRNAQATAERLWEAVGSGLGNTPSANENRGATNTANSNTGERT